MTKRKRWPTDDRWPNLRWDPDARGNVRCYHRDLDQPGSKQTRLKAEFGTTAFDLEYKAAEAAVRGGAVPERRVEKWKPKVQGQEQIKPKPGGAKSLNALFTAYMKGDHWLTGLGPETRVNRRLLLESVFAMVKDGRTIGERSYLTLDTYGVRAIYKEIAATYRGKAMNWLIAFTQIFVWAMESEYDKAIKVNPCIGIKRLPTLNPYGHMPWTSEHIHKYLDFYAEGTEAHRAMLGFLYTGARGSDFVRIGDDMIFDAIDSAGNHRQVISFEPTKNRERKLREGKRVTPAFIPILPPLQELLDARPAGQSRLFVTRLGNVITRGSMTRKMRGWIRALDWGQDASGQKLKAPKLTPHGLRKACTTFLLQAKVAHEDIAAIMGWEDMRMVMLYAKEFDREAAALSGMPSFTIPAPRKRPNLRAVEKVA
jgi:hypothetical protein